jgi:hypothetical protein
MLNQNVSFDEVYTSCASHRLQSESMKKFLAWKIYSIVTDHYRVQVVFATGYPQVHRI